MQLDLIAVLRREGHSAPRILERLREEFGSEARGQRTVQNHVKRIDENRLRWDRFATDGGDARLIFEVLAEVIKVSDHNKESFTQEEADTVLWVRQTAPDLPPYYVWITAVLYMAELRVRPAEDQDFASLDAFLALKPWQSLDAMIKFDDIYQQGKIGRSSPVGAWNVQQGHSIINVARLARQQAYKKETEQEMAELEQSAMKGDANAVLALSLLEHSDGEILLERQRNQAEALIEAVNNPPQDEWPIDANSWVAQNFPEREGGDAIET